MSDERTVDRQFLPVPASPPPISLLPRLRPASVRPLSTPLPRLRNVTDEPGSCESGESRRCPHGSRQHAGDPSHMTATPPIPGTREAARPFPRRALSLLLVLAAILPGCNVVPTMAAREPRIDPEEEARLGAIAYEEMLATHPLSQDTAAIQLVQQVGQRLATASGRIDVSWDFKVVEDDSPRATALPGGRVIVADSTLGVCGNEAQLAAVIAGAMGRRLARHAARPASSSSSLVDPTANQSPWHAPSSVEADSIALSILVGAGYDPEAAQQVWFGASVAGGDANITESTAQSRTSRQGSFLLALDRARFIYRSHPQPLGYGQPIAWSPRLGPPSGSAPAHQEIWTAAINRGAAKPPAWNADLNVDPAPVTTIASRGHETSPANQDGDEFLPPKAGAEIQPAVYEWSSADEALVPRPADSQPPIEFVQPAEWESPTPATTPATLPGPLLP